MFMLRFSSLFLTLWIAGCSPDASTDEHVMPVAPILPPPFLVDQPDRLDRGLPTNFTQAAAGAFDLPALFDTIDAGTGVSPEAWLDSRRAVVMGLLAEHQFGRTPDIDVRMNFDVWDAGTPAYEDKAVRKQVRIELANELGQAAIDVVTYLPANATGPSPVLLSLQFSPVVLSVEDEGVREIDGWITTDGPPHQVPAREARSFGKVDVAAYMDAGIGLALVYYGQIEPDFEGGADLGVRALTRADANREVDEWGSIGAWAWGASRIVDYLESDAGVDSKRIGVMGFSRLGKTALWAAAQDPRFAAVIDCCSGMGGQSLSRRNYGETIAHITTDGAYPYWFAPRFATYAADATTLPVDAHYLLAAIAPRPVLLINGHEDSWADPFGAFLAAQAASPAWTLLGAEGIAQDAPFPELDSYAGDDLRYFIHTGGHGSAPSDLGAILSFLTEKLAG